MTVFLGISSGLCWGLADFLGGLQARRISALAVTLWSQLAGGLGLLLVLITLQEPPPVSALLWGAAAGVFGGTALLLFYRGLALGAMTVVAPISASGVLVPVLVGLALGERPGRLATLGIGVTILGILLVSLQERARAGDEYRARAALPLALGAAMGFGLFYVFVDRGVTGDFSPLWAIAGARAGSLTTLLLILSVGRQSAPWPGRLAWPVALVGILDTSANALFAYATTRGELGVASVLGSLYPVTTVLLGRFVLREHLTSLQTVGILLALTGVGLISGG